MKKRILVFGAGHNQTLLIRACKELGYHTVVTDPNTEAPGKALADHFVVLPPKDFEAHCELIEQEKIQGIVTCQMENPLPLMAKLAQRYKLLFPTAEVIQRARNKFLMKQTFLKEEVPCAQGQVIDIPADLDRLDFNHWNFPLIIKPVDSYSSRGVYKVNSLEDLKARYSEAVRFSSTGQVLVEEFLEGPEVSVEAVTYQGKTHIVQITDKVITPYPNTVELAHYQPSLLEADQQQSIEQVVRDAIKALGIDYSGSHAELKLTPQGPKMIEIGARLGGDYISSYLTTLSTGVDMNRAIAQIAVGEEPDVTPSCKQYSGIQYVNWPTGRKVKAIASLDPFLQNPKVAFANIMVAPGDTLPAVTESTNRHAFFITSGSSKAELEQNVQMLSADLSKFITLD